MAGKSLLTDQPENIIRNFRQLLEREGIPVEKMILFGSYAKGQAKPWSDLDVAVISEHFGKDSHRELVRLLHLSGEIEPMIEPHPLHPKMLSDKWNPLAREILKYGKLIE